MKKIIFIILIFNLFFGKEVLLDRFEARGYLLEIRQQIKNNQKKCFLYVFKRKNKDYIFYKSFDLLTKNQCYFKGDYITSERRYNKKGHWYTVKKKKREFKVHFLDFHKTQKNITKVRDIYRKIVKDTIGVLHMVGGKEFITNDEEIKKKFGRGSHYYPKSFYGDKNFHIVLLKNGDILVYKGKGKGLCSHIGYITKQYSFGRIFTYALLNIEKYPEIDFRYDPRERFIDICPQITPPKKSQKPMLNAKIKPYKNLAGNRIEQIFLNNSQGVKRTKATGGGYAKTTWTEYSKWDKDSEAVLAAIDLADWFKDEVFGPPKILKKVTDQKAMWNKIQGKKYIIFFGAGILNMIK